MRPVVGSAVSATVARLRFDIERLEHTERQCGRTVIVELQKWRLAQQRRRQALRVCVKP